MAGRCTPCESHDVPLTDTQYVWLTVHRSLHQLGREIFALVEKIADRLGQLAR